MSGQLKYDFIISGLKKHISDLGKAKNLISDLTPMMKKNRKVQQEVTAALKRNSAAVANVAKGQKYFKGATEALNKSLTKSNSYLRGFQSGYALASKNIVKTTANLKRNVSSVTKSTSAWKKYTSRVHENVKGHKSWWDSFGRVAIGFGIAYRLINLVENAVAGLTEAFRGGLSAMDEYRKSVATVAGMLSLLSTGGSYKGRFNDFSTVMGATMRETMRIMPKYRLSIEEIGDAYKELAQFGVIVAPKDVDKTLISLSAIKEIAVTTGSSSKQIRQELQAVFNGSKRITDQYGRFLAKFPELEKKIYGVNKLTTSNAEKWKLATDAIADYGLSIIRANETVGAQGTIIKNTLQILSMDSLKLTGIYDKWVSILKNISTSLIDDQGKLQSLGKQVVHWFGAGWIVLDNTRKALVGFYTTMTTYKDVVKNQTGRLNEFSVAMAKLVVVGSIAVGVFKNLYKLVRFLISPWALIAAGVLLLKSAFSEWLSMGLMNELQTVVESIKTIYNKVTDLFEKFRKYRADRLADTTTVRDYTTRFGGIGIAVPGEEVPPEDRNTNMETTAKFAGKVLDRFKGDIKSYMDFIVKAVTGMGLEEFTIDTSNIFDAQGLEAGFARVNELMNKYKMATQDTFKELKEKSKETWQYVGDGFSTYFTSIVSGEIKSFEDLWKLTLTTIRDTWAQAMSDMASDAINRFFRKVAMESQANGTSFLGTAIKAIGGAVVGAFGGGSEWGGYNSNYEASQGIQLGFASGGIIPEPVVGVGASGTTYSFAERGPERVLSNSESFGASQPTSVTVEVINKSSQPVKGSQGTTRMDIKGMVTQIVLEDIAVRGPMTRARGMA